MRIEELDLETRKRMARSLDTSSETLDQLVDDADWNVCILAISNPSTSPKTLDRLAHCEKRQSYIYNRIAQNPRTSQETLDYLANNEDEYVRNEVAANPNTSSKTLDRLSCDTSHDISFWIQLSVAWNPSTSKETLDRLVKSEDKLIRSVAASRKNK